MQSVVSDPPLRFTERRIGDLCLSRPAARVGGEISLAEKEWAHPFEIDLIEESNRIGS